MSRSESDVATTKQAIGGSGGATKEHQRLCHIVKRADFDGYGFNLHSEKGKPGQFIGKVDENSPAEEAGLKQGDRIIEVNGVNIGSETHKQVVSRIKAITCEVRLLVIDPNVEKKFQNIANNNDMSTTSTTSMASTVTMQSSATMTTTTAKDENDGQTQSMQLQQHSNNNNANANNSSNNNNSSISTNNGKTATAASPDVVRHHHDEEIQIQNATNGHHQQQVQPNNGAADQPPMSITMTSTKTQSTNVTHGQNGSSPTEITSTLTTGNGTAGGGGSVAESATDNAIESGSIAGVKKGGLNLPMTAAEMRAKLLAKKKYDPKNDTVDLRKKFEIIQKL